MDTGQGGAVAQVGARACRKEQEFF